MTDDASQDRSTSRTKDTSGLAAGFTMFAAVMMIMAGVFQAMQGLVGIFENEFYVPTRNYLFLPYYRLWAILIIAVDIFVIWALTAHGREFKELKAAEDEYRMHR